MNRTSSRTLLAVASLATASCKAPEGLDRAAVYAEIATNVIAPSYADLRTKTEVLATAATTYCADASNTAAFTALRTALADAHVAYARTNAFELTSSPVVVGLIPVLLDGYPVDEAAIDTLLGSGSGPFDFTMQPASVQGFYAAEYLLESGSDLAADQARFTDVATGARRCQYVLDATARIATLGDRAADAWDPPGETTFGHQFEIVGEPGATYATVGVASTDLTMTIHNLARDLADERIGRPLGILAMGPTTPTPSLVPGRYAHWTKADITASLDSIESFYLGRYGATDGRGMEDVVRARSRVRDQHMKDQLAAARAAVEAIPGSIDAAVAGTQPAPAAPPAELVAAFDALKALQTLIALEIGPTISVFSSAFDSDGD